MEKFKRFFIGLAFAFGYMAIWVILELTLTEPSIKQALQIGAGILFVIAGFYFMFKPKPEKDTRAVEAKIRAMKQAGQPLAYEREEPFNSQDLYVFTKRRQFLLVTLLASCLIIPGLVAFVIYVFANPENKFFYQVLGIGVSVIVLACLGLYDYRSLTRDITSGKKTIVRGVVTRKRMDGGADRGLHFIEIDTLSVFVNPDVYNKYQVGDGIEIHIYKPRRNMILYEKKLND